MNLNYKSLMHFHYCEKHSTGIEENTLNIIKVNAVERQQLAIFIFSHSLPEENSFTLWLLCLVYKNFRFILHIIKLNLHLDLSVKNASPRQKLSSASPQAQVQCSVSDISKRPTSILKKSVFSVNYN